MIVGTILLIGLAGCTKTAHLSVDNVSRFSSKIIGLDLKSGESIECAEQGCMYHSAKGTVAGMRSDGTRFSAEMKDIAAIMVRSIQPGSSAITISAPDFEDHYDSLKSNQKDYTVKSVYLKSDSTVFFEQLGRVNYDRQTFEGIIYCLASADDLYSDMFDDIDLE